MPHHYMHNAVIRNLLCLHAYRLLQCLCHHCVKLCSYEKGGKSTKDCMCLWVKSVAFILRLFALRIHQPKKKQSALLHVFFENMCKGVIAGC